MDVFIWEQRVAIRTHVGTLNHSGADIFLLAVPKAQREYFLLVFLSGEKISVGHAFTEFQSADALVHLFRLSVLVNNRIYTFTNEKKWLVAYP